MNSAEKALKAQKEIDAVMAKMGVSPRLETWQKKYLQKKYSTARGMYYQKLKSLAERKNALEEELFELCLNEEEYSICTEELAVWYHNQRLIAMKHYFDAEKRVIPTKAIMDKRREACNADR